jgi:hypothetical protein
VGDAQGAENTLSDAIKALIESQKEKNMFVRHYEETRFKIRQMTYEWPPRAQQGFRGSADYRHRLFPRAGAGPSASPPL